MNISIHNADRLLVARPASDGEGVLIKRIAGQHYNSILDPFLLIDEIDLNEDDGELGGFPAHPHRGFQTLTYMLKGGFRHEDSMGNVGEIHSGGIQWMSAASGVIHSEMPIPEQGELHGFQLWLNLPAREKMRAPEYRDIQGEQIPSWPLAQGGKLSVLVGELNVDGSHFVGALRLVESHAIVARLSLPTQQTLCMTIPEHCQFNVLLFNGQLDGLEQGQLANFSAVSHARSLSLITLGQSADVLVLAGVPIQEPIAQYGPFVMNTKTEIEQALRDYRDNKLVQ